MAVHPVPSARRPRPVRALGLIGDRRTAAAVDREGAIVWYCPERFDRPSLFAALLDPDAGAWVLHLPGARPAGRRYIGESAVLETTLRAEAGEWRITDWMPLHRPAGICRTLSPAPAEASVEIRPRPDYARRDASYERVGEALVVDSRHYIYASVPPEIGGGAVHFHIPAGRPAWFVLAREPLAQVNGAMLERWRRETERGWEALHGHTRYAGPYEREVKDSLRALRLLTFQDNGGAIAAATLGLPEVIGGERNYDYRYVWLRDTAMIVSALIRAGSDGVEERRFLDFLCSTARHRESDVPLPPFLTLSGKLVPRPQALPWRGYRDSRPVVVGNGARDQLQLGGLSNVLLAAKLVYNRFDTRDHWPVVRAIADFVAAHWQEPDHGMWEEPVRRHYTSSKVLAARSLEFIAAHADDPAQAQRWREAAGAIRGFVDRHCRTRDGAYASVAGGEGVDVSAALFPVWDYCPPDTPAMLATMACLEREHAEGLLYRRRLECFDARREGAFLAGTLWVAQYWVTRGDLERAERILAAALGYANDLGLFAEEAAPSTGEMLGNFPQAFVHAALVGLVVDLKAARAR